MAYVYEGGLHRQTFLRFSEGALYYTARSRAPRGGPCNIGNYCSQMYTAAPKVTVNNSAPYTARYHYHDSTRAEDEAVVDRLITSVLQQYTDQSTAPSEYGQHPRSRRSQSFTKP